MDIRRFSKVQIVSAGGINLRGSIQVLRLGQCCSMLGHEGTPGGKCLGMRYLVEAVMSITQVLKSRWRLLGKRTFNKNWELVIFECKSKLGKNIN